MFPLPESNKPIMSSYISFNAHRNRQISEDLIFRSHDALTIGGHLFDNNTGRENLKRKFADQNSMDNEKRKIHREIERQRRQEMATLFVSLRSLLPPDLIKGKRSAHEYMNEAVTYINRLKKEIKELESKRNELKKVLSLSTLVDNENRKFSNSSFTVRPSCGGFQIVICTTYGDNGSLPFSRVLKVLLEEGLCVFSCISSKINNNLVHTIQSEVCQLTSMDQTKLEKRLTEVNPSLRHMISE